MIDIRDKYFTETESIKSEPGCWNVLKVSIFMKEGDEKIRIGEYVRNYHSLFNTFVPFRQGDREYALYSRHYTATRIMSLPDCRDLGGEEPAGNGFCPTGYYVPVAHELDRGSEFDPDGMFGFVSGCVWGDDSSWKIQYLDLSRAPEGIVSRDARFGYIELLDDMYLKDAISIEMWEKDDPIIDIACAKRFNANKRYDND